MPVSVLLVEQDVKIFFDFLEFEANSFDLFQDECFLRPHCHVRLNPWLDFEIVIDDTGFAQKFAH